MFSRELRRRLPADSGITSLAVHPGMVASDIVRHLPGPILWLYRAVMGAILLTTQQGEGGCRSRGRAAVLQLLWQQSK
jgi:NAD(P)-dependent dehydrogenase (short-subunit alcohol dehydrogenase family)